MVSLSDRIHELVGRMAERSNDPEFRRQAARLAEEAREAERVSAELERARRLRSSGVPELFWTRLDSPDATPAFEAAQRFMAAPAERAFLVLAGPAGRGKSFALAWAVYRYGGTFVDALELVTASSYESAFWGELESARVLALDELGAEYRNESYDSNLYALLNRRYMAGRKTIIATNLDKVAFQARYFGSGMERLADRIRNSGELVTVPGRSMREGA